MKIPDGFDGLKLALGDDLPNNHPLTQLICKARDYAAELDQRYKLVFSNPRFIITEPRRERLSNDLSRLEVFMYTDAEIQTAANLLAHDEVKVHAGTEGGARNADYTVDFHRLIDTEVRIVQESKEDQEIDECHKRIVNRIEGSKGLQDHLVVLRVRKVRNAEDQFILDGKVEKRFVHFASKIADQATEEELPIFITLQGNGIPMIADFYTGRDKELASLEIKYRAKVRQGKKASIIGFGGLSAPDEATRVKKALKKKSARKQRTENRPFVVVLDTSGSMLLLEDEIRQGVLEHFDSGKGNISAVVIQRRSLQSWAFIPNPDAPWEITFNSYVIKNPRANYPLSDEEVSLFETKVTQQTNNVR